MTRSGEGAWRKGVRFLRGDRFIDLPIRAIALFLAVGAFMPGSAESDDPLYLMLFVASQVLIVAAAFVPGSSAIASAALYLLHLSLFPQHINSFEESLYFSAAALLAFGRWHAWAVAAVSILGLARLSLGLQSDVAAPFSLVGIALVFGGILGLSAWGLEHRIQTEISAREKAAISHEQETQRLRVQFVVDTHDTVSHSLATEAGIIRILSKEVDQPAASEALSNLAMVNTIAQQELRTLLARLRSMAHTDPSTVTSRQDFLRDMESIVRTAESGGVEITTQISGLPAHVDSGLAEQVLFIIRELVTNIVKHSSSAIGGRLVIKADAASSGLPVTITASNPMRTGETELPRSLAARVAALGGSVATDHGPDRFSITVELPWHATNQRISPEQGMPR